jgi:cytochrome aa3-600 menaquinol oxidase subunit II
MLPQNRRLGIHPRMGGNEGNVPAKSKNAIIMTILAASVLLTGCSPEYVVLNPAGPVGKTELNLIVLSTILVLIVIIPVLILLGFILYRYRDKPGNTAPYMPNWAHSNKLEVVWWGIPIVIVSVLGAVTAKMTFDLTEPPSKNAEPLTIQVTSLDWKWLFQYPGQKVATVNYADIPVGRPIQFVLTADAPMNSFWVPQLGGQEYTMPGMAMNLWLQADKPGVYTGRGANFTGKGFAHNTFTVRAVSQQEFDQWVSQLKQTAPPLTMQEYDKLTKPSLMGTASYSSFPPNLFQNVINKDGSMNMGNQGSMAMGNTTVDNSTNTNTGSSTSNMNMSNMNMNNMNMSSKH